MPQSPKSLYQQRLREGRLTPDPAQARAVQALELLYRQAPGVRARRGWLRRSRPVRGLYFYGGVGRGKSMLMDLFYECLPAAPGKQRVHFHAFMLSVHDALHAERTSDARTGGGRPRSADAALPLLAARIAAQSPILCFDEFDVTDVADAMILGRLFAALFARGVIVVSTSNRAPDRLYEGGLQRERFLPFIALLKEHQRLFHLDGPTDYRTRFIAKEGSYFTPLNQETKRRMDSLFARLTDHAPAPASELSVQGRTIPVPAAAKGVARFTFAGLCERPCAAADYLEIARHYHTVFLENVPKLKYDRRNEARRLIILIDTLYEARARVVISAEAPAERL